MMGYPKMLLLILIPFLAGILVLRFRSWIQPRIKIFLSFSASFLLAICLTHLLPEVFGEGEQLGLYVLLGFFIQIVLEFFSAGIEHGHIHKHVHPNFPYLLFLSLFIHSYIEGFPIAEAALFGQDSSTPGALLSAVVLHKIPIAVVLTSLLIDKKLKTGIILLSLFIFSISAPLGVLTVYGAEDGLSSNLAGPLTAIAIGIFLHVSTVILFESSENHRFNVSKFIAIVLGILLAIITFGWH